MLRALRYPANARIIFLHFKKLIYHREHRE